MESNFTALSSAIITVLESVTQDSSVAFADIQQYPGFIFTGYPAVTVAPSDNRSDYATTVQNERTYGFYVDLFDLIEDPSDAVAIADVFTNMRVLVDTTLNAFDNCDSLGGACDILVPAPSSWLVIESGASVVLNARITLSCKVSVQQNNG